MSSDELDRYMFSLEGYLRKVDALKHVPRQALCNSLLPNFGSIGLIFLENCTFSQSLKGLQIVLKLIFYAKETKSGEVACPALNDFIHQLQDQIYKGKISPTDGFETHKLTYLLPAYRKTLVLTLIKDCLKNQASCNVDIYVQRSDLVEECGKLNKLFFSIILTFCEILQSTNGHWFIGKIINNFKKFVISQVNGNILSLYPLHLHPFLPHLELLNQQLTQQSICSSSQPYHASEKLCRNLDKSLSLGICKWQEIIALLILYPIVADFLILNKEEWVRKHRNFNQIRVF